MTEQGRRTRGETTYGYPTETGFPGDREPLYGPPYGGGHTSGRAVGSAIVGVFGLFFFGVVLGVIALLLSASARRDMYASAGQVRGAGWASVGRILGWIDIVLWAIGIVWAILAWG
jgi:hypothetical protein